MTAPSIKRCEVTSVASPYSDKTITQVQRCIGVFGHRGPCHFATFEDEERLRTLDDRVQAIADRVTVMTIALSLIAEGKFDPKEIARRALNGTLSEYLRAQMEKGETL